MENNENKQVEEKNIKKNGRKALIAIIVILILIIVGLLAFIGIKLEWFGNKEDSDKNTTSVVNNTNNSSENNEIENTVNNVIDNVSKNNTDENTVNKTGDDNQTEKNENEMSSGVKKLQISDEAILNILIDTEPFENGANLSTQQYLAIVYNALNEDYVVIDKDRSSDSGNGKVEFTVDEINSIIYSLFGVTLKSYENYGDVFIYKNGKYILQHSDRGASVPVAKSVSKDAAAGTAYINYDLYLRDENEGIEDFNGSYSIGRSGVTSFVSCKKKM